MDDPGDPFPSWPPGLWRRILLQPGSGWIGAALEDDAHRFHLRIEHQDGRIARASAKGVRIPWTGCSGAPDFIAGELTGVLLADVAGRDPAQHCTHLLDLAIVAAAHADDSELTIYDMQVADRVEDRTTATLFENGEPRLQWQLRDTAIEAPEPFAGLDLRQLSSWKQDFPTREAEWSTLLRRAVFISGLRRFAPPVGERAADMGLMRRGACFNYQMPQVENSTSIMERRDFSVGRHEPLEGFEPQTVFGAMA